MSITGDYQKLRKLRAGFDGMKTQGFKAGLCRQMAQHERDLVLQCFERARDPYGRAWKPLRSRRGRPLRKSGRLYNSIGIRANAWGWAVQTPVFYAGFQNSGTRTIPARMYIPTRGLPAAWRFELVDVANEYVVKFVKR